MTISRIHGSSIATQWLQILSDYATSPMIQMPREKFFQIPSEEISISTEERKISSEESNETSEESNDKSEEFFLSSEEIENSHVRNGGFPWEEI